MSSPAQRYAAAKKRAQKDQTGLSSFQRLYDFPLDPFQIAACEALAEGRGVLVAAPTGAGKTVVGEFAVHLAIESGRWTLPLVQKTRTAGYDGKGVAVLRTKQDLETKLLPGACIAEILADIQVEIAVIAAKNPAGDVAVFPAVEMDFHPEANLVEFLLCPARVSSLVEAEAEALAERVIRALDVCGLLAVEMFLTKSGELIVNESAPRPHNSGHHTIDSAITSQFEQHLRAITDLPLGAGTQKVAAAVMLNLLGEPGHKGPVHYEGAEKCLAMEGVHLHLYGKALTAPFRKMGHATITADSIELAIKKADFVKKHRGRAAKGVRRALLMPRRGWRRRSRGG